MNIGVLKGIGAFVLLLLAQSLVLNHIHLFGCATPLLYVYMVTLFRHDVFVCRYFLEHARSGSRFDDACRLVAALSADAVSAA